MATNAEHQKAWRERQKAKGQRSNYYHAKHGELLARIAELEAQLAAKPDQPRAVFVHDIEAALQPVIDGLMTEGKKHVARMSGPTVTHLAHQIALQVSAWKQGISAKEAQERHSNAAPVKKAARSSRRKSPPEDSGPATAVLPVEAESGFVRREGPEADKWRNAKVGPSCLLHFCNRLKQVVQEDTRVGSAWQVAMDTAWRIESKIAVKEQALRKLAKWGPAAGIKIDNVPELVAAKLIDA
jgi:hypothetical protein